MSVLECDPNAWRRVLALGGAGIVRAPDPADTPAPKPPASVIVRALRCVCGT